MKPKKIGLLALALVLALGALGVGYATWTDTITIEGTVETGSVDINVEYYSGTIIYKDLTDDSLQTYFYVADDQGVIKWSMGTPYDEGNANHVFVASAAACPDGRDDYVDVDYVNAFPTQCLCADFIVHYVGSVPAMVTADFDTWDSMLEWLWDNGYVTLYAARVTIVDEPGNWQFSVGEMIEGPIQMHECQYAKIWIWIDLPQDEELVGTPYTQEDFMGQTWYFTAHISATQWND